MCSHSGGYGCNDTNILARCARDHHVLRRHATVADMEFERLESRPCRQVAFLLHLQDALRAVLSLWQHAAAARGAPPGQEHRRVGGTLGVRQHPGRSSCVPADAVPEPLCLAGCFAPAACSAVGSAVSEDGDGAQDGGRAGDVPARLVSRTHRRTLLFVAGAALGSGAGRQAAPAQAATASFCLECGGTGIVACALHSCPHLPLPATPLTPDCHSCSQATCAAARASGGR
jgi:hypothetical protein